MRLRLRLRLVGNMGASIGDEEVVERRPLVFALNGERVELASVDPSTTLLSYLRTESQFKGTKRGCGEGEQPQKYVL